MKEKIIPRQTRTQHELWKTCTYVNTA